MKAHFEKYTLRFKQQSVTSRGVLNVKHTYFLKVESEGRKVIGECSLLQGLSRDDRPDYEEMLEWVCHNIHLGKQALYEYTYAYPSIQMGIEEVFLALKNADSILFPSDFTLGKDSIPINGLIWMGTIDFMKKQIQEKLNEKYTCIKIKIGSLNFEDEYTLLKKLRKQVPNLEIRVDANGGFNYQEARGKLERLAQLKIHSIEQPIQAGQIRKMRQLCEDTSLPIALDEELINTVSKENKEALLAYIKPQYIVLKPSLVGGFKSSEEWISLANQKNIGWWITSALESNVGLNAIAQWTYTLDPLAIMPQGLGTGKLYINNTPSSLEIKEGKLYFTGQNL